MALCPEKKTWWKIRLFSGQPIYSPGLDIASFGVILLAQSLAIAAMARLCASKITHRNIQEFYCKGVVPFSHQTGLTRKFLPEQFLQNTCLGKYNCYWVCFFGECVVVWILFCVQGPFKNQGIATIELNFLPCSLVHRNTSWKGLLREFKDYCTFSLIRAMNKRILRTLYVFLLLAKSDKTDALSMYIQSWGDLHLHVMRHCQA